MKKIFIGGCDRSGTTMLASLLASIDSAIVTPESLFKTDLLVHKSFDQLNQDWRFKNWNLKHLSLSEKFDETDSYNDILEYLVNDYAKKIGIQNPEVWIDHSPNNIEYAKLHIENFSNLYFIHIIRDVRAVANSIIPLEWGPNTSFYASLYWSKKLATNFSASTIPSIKLLNIKYEDLISNKEEQLAKIFNFVNVRHPSRIEPQNYFLPSFTKKQHAQVGSELDLKKLDNWKTNLSSNQIKTINFLTFNTLNNLGYYPEKAKMLPFFLAFELLKECIFRQKNKIVYFTKRKK